MMDATFMAPGIVRQTFTMRDVRAVCALDGEPFTCDVIVRYAPVGHALTMEFVGLLVRTLVEQPVTAESLAYDIRQEIRDQTGSTAISVTVRHHEKHGVELTVETG